VSFDQITVELQESMGNDRSIAECAWTSSTTHGGILKKTDAQVSDLVKRLATDGHATPFESVVLRFWMRIPIFVDRQHMTHRIASHNGMSGRYRTMPTDYYTMPEDVAAILCDKLGGVAYDELFGELDQPGSRIIADYATACDTAMEMYEISMLKLKFAKAAGTLTDKEYKRVREILRGMCPQAGMTERVTTMNLRAFANYQQLRNSEHAQDEIRLLAQLMLAAVKVSNPCPVAIEWLEQNGWKL